MYPQIQTFSRQILETKKISPRGVAWSGLCQHAFFHAAPGRGAHPQKA